MLASRSAHAAAIVARIPLVSSTLRTAIRAPNATSMLAPAAASPFAAQLGRRTLFTRSSPTPLARTKQFIYLVFALAAGTLGVAYYADSRSAIHRWIAIPALKAFADPESAQKLAIKMLETGLAPRDLVDDDAVLQTELFGRKLSNPIGLAAGFDKQAEAIDGLLDLGFGFVEIGSVTPEPQPGNPQPRYFRLIEDNACINRFGFNSEGHNVILSRLRDRVRRWLLHSSSVASLQDALVSSPDSATPDARQLIAAHPKSTSAFVDATDLPRSLRPAKMLGINLGKNKTSPEESVDDYVKGVERLGPYADMIIVNVSSPNTPGLRRLQRRGVLEDLLTKVVKARNSMVESHLSFSDKKIQVPLLVKIAPDLTEDELHDVADAALKSGIDGLVISNTTISRPAFLRSSEHVRETGGLSGPPVKPLALKALTTVNQRLQGKLPIIGCGGIASGQDALDYAKAGASAIELYTSFGYQGVGLPRRIKDELVDLLKAQGTTWKEIVGSGVDLSNISISAPNAQVATGLHPGSDTAFKKSVASVKLELDGLRSKLGISTPLTKDNLKSFLPTRESDAGYFDLIQKAHSALGLEFAAGEETTVSAPKSNRLDKEGKDKSTWTTTQGEKQVEKAEQVLRDPKVPNMKVEVKDKTKKVFGETVEGRVGQAEENAKNRAYGLIDKVRVV
ncbi:related to dihydroorotate dehydrogenase, mitochondrial precursor [Melanopsichium pennsylvanicum]|uniref:Dihydroorotate dehydrogenase (quinone), mitochondrial n=2 Tax=Melanopsichium pennsylvanicum TaxID=63383 RepID=A0AAJ5C5R7_9BASI|nr:related to dihydroorotate dehydrogenase, mitochondrial precursor [Melanopsichium pennsylvanicum 4]SNX85021.1 related to dihydroorotate dehydrogenase, mitochondrial precursor [Melanopsichium pennsylvanicum]